MNERASNRSLVSWFLQRISGIFLAIFLITHLNVHHLFHDITTEGILNFESVRSNLASSVWWQVYYFIFVPFVVFHALNGLWGILADYCPPGRLAIFLRIVFWIIGTVLTVVGAMTLINLF